MGTILRKLEQKTWLLTDPTPTARAAAERPTRETAARAWSTEFPGRATPRPRPTLRTALTCSCRRAQGTTLPGDILTYSRRVLSPAYGLRRRHEGPARCSGPARAALLNANRFPMTTGRISNRRGWKCWHWRLINGFLTPQDAGPHAALYLALRSNGWASLRGRPDEARRKSCAPHFTWRCQTAGRARRCTRSTELREIRIAPDLRVPAGGRAPRPDLDGCAPASVEVYQGRNYLDMAPGTMRSWPAPSRDAPEHPIEDAGTGKHSSACRKDR